MSTAELRATTPLDTGWRFVQDDRLSGEEALASDASGWTSVSLPHTWNAEDAASLRATKPYKRGIGWYRLEFETPARGDRAWLELGAASIVADVWLNGKKLGSHEGAFTAFRFDVTDALAKRGRNVLVVKVDNSAPKTKDDRTAILPLGGDFNMSGGLYRYVALVSTRDPVHFDLGDMGASGVYATTTSIDGGTATIQVRSKLKNDAARRGEYVVRVSLVDAGDRTAATEQRTVALEAGAAAEITQELRVAKPRLWQGVEDPYLYRLVAELIPVGGAPIDRVVHPFGIRQMRFDAAKGFFLNGKHVRLRGVAVHQDYLGKGWAMTDRDMDESLALVKEIGANAIRLGHYPFSQHALDTVDRMGLVAWSEIPYGIGVTVQPVAMVGNPSPCPTEDPTPRLRENAKRQAQEAIRQQLNHASIGMWSVGNEITFQHKDCPAAWHDNLTPLLRELNALAKREDPSRVTTLADFTETVDPPLVGGYIAVGGITDIWAINQYYLWYSGAVAGLGVRLDALHARYPAQPMGMSEYGAGAALTHHTDDVHGGKPEAVNTGVPVCYQPEEYASYAHEQNYAMLESKEYLWGTFVWNMFDFGSGIRNEGDVRGVNTKGLVSFDRKTRKDPFFFYKANWSREPVTYVTSRRYTDRAYAINDVKVYSNADSVELTINGKSHGKLNREQCLLSTCVFEDVRLDSGTNEVVAVGDHGGRQVRDAVRWTFRERDAHIAAGQLTTGFRSAAGERFGSDRFFTGGLGEWLVPKDYEPMMDTTPVKGTSEPELFKSYRRGTFAYAIPLDDGTYRVTLRFLEPDRATQAGHRVFDVVANGETKLDDFDVLKEAGAYRTVVAKTFTVPVTGGRLELRFEPARGEAVVSNLSVARVQAGVVGRRPPSDRR